MDENSLRFDDNEEVLNALTLRTLLDNGAEVLLNLSPAQLIQLEKKVQKTKGASSGGSSSKKRRLSDTSSDHPIPRMERPRPTGGQYMNLPASTPQVEFRNGIEWLIFTYSTKGHIQEYHIRGDLDDIGPDEIPEDFKADNCVYPRALVPREAYIGNRWEYETAVNEIAWKLCWRNPGVLSGKRGLIQRAVDSYRNRTPENRSRRVMRQEKLQHNSPFAKRAAVMDGAAAMGMAPTPMIRVPGPKTLTLQYPDNEGAMAKMKIRVDIEGVDLAQVDEDFRSNNAIFPQAMIGGPGYTNERWEYENACNELGWKLAWVNSTKLAGKRNLLHKAVEAYQGRIEAAEKARQAVLQHHHQILGNAAAAAAGSYDPSLLYDPQTMHGIIPHMMHHEMHAGDDGSLLDKNEFSQMVAQALQQALAQGVTADSGMNSAGYHLEQSHHHHHLAHHAHHGAVDAHGNPVYDEADEDDGHHGAVDAHGNPIYDETDEAAIAAVAAGHHLPYSHAIVDDHQFHHHHHIDHHSRHGAVDEEEEQEGEEPATTRPF